MLRYSYKRISTFVPRYLGNSTLKRILFIQKFLDILEDDKYVLLVLDEVGFGTKNTKHYAYSKIGKPVCYEKPK